MTIKPQTGVVTALITPFLTDYSIDWQSFDRLLDTQIEGKVNGVVISGTTGEASTLSVQEKLSLVRRARAQLPREISVMAGTGGQSTEQTIELSKLAIDAGADSLLVVTPPYNKPSFNGLMLHFSEISNACHVPIMLYHVPGRTAQTLTSDEMAKICQIKHVNSIKEASGDIALFSKTVLETQVAVLTGDDPSYLPSLIAGGKGVVSVLTNIYPQAFVAMTKAFEKGDNKKALAIHQALLPMIEVLFCESNPGPIKFALAQKGLCEDVLRSPLCSVNESNEIKIKEAIDKTEQGLISLL